MSRTKNKEYIYNRKFEVFKDKRRRDFARGFRYCWVTTSKLLEYTKAARTNFCEQFQQSRLIRLNIHEYCIVMNKKLWCNIEIKLLLRNWITNWLKTFILIDRDTVKEAKLIKPYKISIAEMLLKFREKGMGQWEAWCEVFA